MITDITMLNHWADSLNKVKDVKYLINSTSFLCDSTFAGNNPNHFKYDIVVVAVMNDQLNQYKQPTTDKISWWST